MSSVYIPDMDMPAECAFCPLETDYGSCGYYSYKYHECRDTPACGKRDDCPLISYEEMLKRELAKTIDKCTMGNYSFSVPEGD